MFRKIGITLTICVLLFWSFPLFAFAALSPSSSELYVGMDVSVWQGDIDFEQAAADGIQVVYIRSSYGGSGIDEQFSANYEKAKAAGMKIGFYHYLTARTVSQAVYQAHFFVNTIGERQTDCLLAMDFEDLNGLSPGEINDIALAFADTVKSLYGHSMLIYSDAYNASEVLSGPITEYPLWVAQYQVSAPSSGVHWPSWAGWQYTDQGRVPGITSDVDLDRFTPDVFLDTPVPLPQIDMPSPGTSAAVYTVQPGDTLWAIAQRYHTTVSALAAENNLSNPSLIYPGQVLQITVQDDDTPQGPYPYTIKPGNTLNGIARRYHTTLAAILRLNHIPNPNLIYPGQIIYLP